MTITREIEKREQDASVQPQYELTRAILNGLLSGGEAVGCWAKGDRDILQETISMTVGDRQIGRTLRTTISMEEVTGAERAGMRLDASQIMAESSLLELPVAKLNALWHTFNQTLERELGYRRADRLETGAAKILDLALARGKTATPPSPEKYFLAVRESSASFCPALYFRQPESFYPVLREQIVQAAERLADLVQVGSVRAPETYALLAMLENQNVQKETDDFGDILVWEEAVEAGGVRKMTLNLEERQGSLVCDAQILLPQAFSRSDLAYLPIDELNNWWQEVNRQLELSGQFRVDQVRAKRGRKLAIVFAGRGADNGGGDMRLRIAETDENGEPLPGGVRVYDYFDKAVDFLSSSREMLTENFTRLQMAMRIGLLNNFQTYRILLSGSFGELSTADKLDDGMDLLTLSIGEDTSRWMSMTLAAEDDPAAKDGLWKVRAGAHFGPMIELPELGKLDTETIAKLWDAFCSRQGHQRSDIIARRGNRMLRIVPQDRGVDMRGGQQGIFFTAVEVDSESGEIVTDEIIVNDWISGDKVRAVNKIAKKMAGCLEQFYHYFGRELEEDARRMRATSPVTQPWLAQTFGENLWAPDFRFDIPQGGIRIDAGGAGVFEKVQAGVAFNGIERQFPIVLFYDPAGDGIGLVIELPSTLAADADFASDSDIQKYLEAMQLVLQRNPMKIFPELDGLVGGIKERCQPKFITKKEGEKTQVFLAMKVAPDELFALHTVGTCYWDELIVWEKLGKAREAASVWMKMLGNVDL